MKELYDNVKSDVKNDLLKLEEVLKKDEYLVDNTLLLCDIAIVCALLKPFQFCFDEEYRKDIPNVTKWFLKICEKEEIKTIIGDVKLCDKPFIPPN